MGDLENTELTLGLPGGGRERAAPSPEVAVSGGLKRGFAGTTGGECKTVDFDFLSHNGKSSVHYKTEDSIQSPPKKGQVIGWPPVASYRKNILGDVNAHDRDFKYVKVAVDGVPYLRKVNLETFNSYEELFKALNHMFYCLNTHAGNCEQGKNNRLQVEYVQTYEDKDGDLMLVGDVPWKMFTETCNRIRLMKSSDAVGLGPITTQQQYE